MRDKQNTTKISFSHTMYFINLILTLKNNLKCMGVINLTYFF